MNFAIWTAVSTPAQAQDDKASLPYQETQCRNLGASKGWLDTSLVYAVPGESRTRYVNLRDAEIDIPPLYHMLEDAKNRRFDLLLLYDYNRLRDLLDPVAKTLASYGVQIYSVNQPVEPLTPADFNPYASDSESIMRGMSQIISRWQTSDLRRKYKYGVRARVDAGLPSLKIPYGYTRPPGREQDRKAIPIPHPAHSLIVIEIKKQFLNGLSIHALRDHLTARYPTPTGIPVWSRQTIRKILTNPFYAGKVFFGSRLTVNDPRLNRKRLVTNKNPYTRDGKHASLYPWTDYLSIQAELTRRASLPSGVRYPWSGLLTCANCHHRLRRKQSRYTCLHCHQTIIHDHELSALIPAAIQQTLRQLPSPSGRGVGGEGETNIEAQTIELNRHRQRIQHAYESELYTLAEAQTKIKDLDAKIKNLRDTVTQAQRKTIQRQNFLASLEQIQTILHYLPQWMLSDDPVKVQRLLHRLLQTILISPDLTITPILRD